MGIGLFAAGVEAGIGVGVGVTACMSLTLLCLASQRARKGRAAPVPVHVPFALGRPTDFEQPRRTGHVQRRQGRAAATGYLHPSQRTGSGAST